MGEVALEFDHVWKKFRKGEVHDSLRDLIPALTRSLLSHNDEQKLHEREFWALEDVSFQVKRGEAFGVIGANGAGKSTTLKLLSRILQPNRGTITTYGRLSALIEVGAGFHPDLTGRENVYLNGAILGMTRQEVARKFDEIVAFAGIGDFIDTPVKRYSSGMYARLGFSVAAHVDPAVLLVDEVLSVGDMQFQQKCLERMRGIVRQGVTVVFVSHNLQAVQMLCNRVLYLKGGQIASLGTTSEVLSEYLSKASASSASRYDTLIDKVILADAEGHPRAEFAPGDNATLRLTIFPSEPIQECLLGFLILRATDGMPVCDYNIPLRFAGPLTPDGRGPVSLAIDLDMNLLRGTYAVSLHIYHSQTARFLSRADRVANFFVNETISWQGVSHVNPRIHLRSPVPGAKES